MDAVSNAKAFLTEVNYIKNDRIRENALRLIEKIPSYFYTEAASSTGKYHPEFSNGVGGLLRHTKVAVKIAETLLRNDSIGYKFTSDEKDLILLAIIMHDSVKRGINEERYTRFDHPILAGELVENSRSELTLTDEEVDLLVRMIKTHMGQWITDRSGKEVLEKPKTKYERFVHMCDYLSAQKFLNVKFDTNNEIIL